MSQREQGHLRSTRWDPLILSWCSPALSREQSLAGCGETGLPSQACRGDVAVLPLLLPSEAWVCISLTITCGKTEEPQLLL